MVWNKTNKTWNWMRRRVEWGRMQDLLGTLESFGFQHLISATCQTGWRHTVYILQSTSFVPRAPAPSTDALCLVCPTLLATHTTFHKHVFWIDNVTIMCVCVCAVTHLSDTFNFSRKKIVQFVWVNALLFKLDVKQKSRFLKLDIKQKSLLFKLDIKRKSLLFKLALSRNQSAS